MAYAERLKHKFIANNLFYQILGYIRYNKSRTTFIAAELSSEAVVF